MTRSPRRSPRCTDWPAACVAVSLPLLVFGIPCLILYLTMPASVGGMR